MTTENAQTAGRESVIIASPSAELHAYLRGSVVGKVCQFESTMGGAEALFLLEQKQFQTVVLDLRIRDLEIGELISEIESSCPATPILVCDSETGRIDFSRSTPRDCMAEEQVRLVEVLSTFKQSREIFQVPSVETLSDDTEEELLPCLVGRSSAMKRTSKLVKLVAPRSTVVLVTGESGTGKELIAKAIHNLSPRSAGPFVVVNCAAIPEALFESELFGYNRGAFTGALESRLGRIHAAHTGTLFLDEVGELPLTMQAKMLRFLQEGEVQRLGSHDIFRVDVRVIAATNSNLQDLISRKQFREDLFYRLMVFPIQLAPLRDRPEDVGPLSEYFLKALSEESGDPKKILSPEALNILRGCEWRGNVRELQHSIERSFILAQTSRVIMPEHLDVPTSPESQEQPLKDNHGPTRKVEPGNYCN